MKLRPFAVYLILQVSSAVIFSLIFTVDMVYQATVVGLSPLQLVLVGTALEATVFLFEVPTGVVADVRSRRLSIIIGHALMGAGFILEGAIPAFATVLVAQLLWGLGYTFTSGATQAWISDEIGEERAAHAFLRGSQAGRFGSLAAIPASVALGSASVALPIVVGGGSLILLAGFLALVMTEEGFSPTPPEERTSWGMMLKTVGDARALVRRRPVLLTLLGISLFYGLYSEGFDRLWTPHLLDNFAVPVLDGVRPVVWFGLIRAVAAGVSIAAVEVVRRRVDVGRPGPIARALTGVTLLVTVALVAFGLVRSFWIAVGLFWLIGALRSVSAPLYDAWFNRRIDDPQVRATMFSVSGQANAIGQIAGGPAVGAVGNASMRAALVASGLLLAPVAPLYAAARRRDAGEET
jgi:DHA3 family tetracycline resistance protein-like MFS transporter